MEKKVNFIQDKFKHYNTVIEQNKHRLKHVPDELMPIEVKEQYLKMKVGIMRRMIRN
jgi:hypothetical protein